MLAVIIVDRGGVYVFVSKKVCNMCMRITEHILNINNKIEFL